MNKKNYPQVHLEQYKYKVKRRKMVNFIDAAVDLSSDDSNDLMIIFICFVGDDFKIVNPKRKIQINMA